jgi:membrane protein
MAFFLFLAIFPFIIFVLSLASRMNLNLELFLGDFQKSLPEETNIILSDILNNYLINDNISLLIFSGVFAFWSVSRSVNALIKAFNNAYGYQETRSQVRIKLIGILYTLVLIVLIIVTIALPTIGREFFEFLGGIFYIPDYFVEIYYVVRAILSVAAYGFAILLIHKSLPAGHLKYRDTIYGSLFSMVFWFLLSRGFNIFVESFTGYAVVYGGLASIVTLMMWMYAVSTVMMLGAEINSTIIDFKKRDFPFDRNIFNPPST